MSNPLRYPSEADRAAPPRWSADGLRARFLVAIALPALVGGLVASFIPWPEWQWAGFAIAAFVTLTGAWLWLDATVARRLVRMARVLEPGADAQGAKPGGGLTALVESAVAARSRERELERGVERLEIVRASLADLTSAAAEWAETERAPVFDAESAPEEVAPLVARLALAAGRLEQRAEAARTVAAQVRETVSEAGGRASTLAAAAERQFVEAASLLTVLRGLDRSSGELAQGVAGIAARLTAAAADSEAARAASETWARGAAAQLEALERSAERLRTAGRDLVRMHEEAQVAAIEAAHAALVDGELAGDDRVRLTDALTALVRSARSAEVRAHELEESAHGDLVRGHEEIGGLRALGARAPTDGVRTSDPLPAARRTIDRLQESVQDAIARGEKLVQQAERTSSEAQRAGEGAQAAMDEVDGLAARFAEAPTAPVAPLEIASDAPEAPQRPLRVLGREDLLPDDDETWSHG